MDAGTKKVRPFGFTDKMGYMFGDFGNDFTFILSSMFLLKFYTDVMGVSAGVVGFIMMLVRCVDAFADVAMGQICDRSKSGAKGKFAPWIRRMCGPVAVASVLMYAVWLQDMSMPIKIFWLVFTYTLWSVCYTGVNIPYGSMASAITAEPRERAALSNFRTIGATLASTVIGVVLPLVVYYKDASGNTAFSGEKMFFAALACSVGAVVCYMICYHMTTERVKMETITERFSLSGLIKVTLANRALVGIIICALLLLLAQLTLNGMGSYIYPNYFGNAGALSLTLLLQSVLTLVLSAFTVKLLEKIGKKELAMIGTTIGAASLVIAFVLHTKNVWIWVGLYLVSTIGIALFNLVCWAMITDVIDDSEVKTGIRSDGTIYAVYSFARKLGQALSSGLVGGLLSFIGYTSLTAFDQTVVDGIYNITCLVPAVGFILLSLALKFVYPLNKKTVEKNAEILKNKIKSRVEK
ncbi:MFS transporter [Konateibacter massiliensis]|uniref:MFS transporter n=1 Tax=Konateibacter massiliensis TaxID=2002841 RepID=UPI000C14A0B9|nr:glycoside-pentoside-hexuronide (GPH):cation symporter [Konateibacter massiliensis]